jgi:hypothetical protein
MTCEENKRKSERKRHRIESKKKIEGKAEAGINYLKIERKRDGRFDKKKGEGKQNEEIEREGGWGSINYIKGRPLGSPTCKGEKSSCRFDPKARREKEKAIWIVLTIGW